MIIVGGFEFIERSDRRGQDGKRSWHCREHKKHKCKATYKTLNGHQLENEGLPTHSHSGDPLLPQVRKVQALIRGKAVETVDSTRSVVSSQLVDLPQDILQRLPKCPSLDDNVNYYSFISNKVQTKGKG